VVDHALDQAARHAMPELHFLTINTKRGSNDDLKEELWRRVYPALETFNEQGAEWRARMHVRHGKPEDEIAALANEVGADLIVIGQFGLHKNKLAGRIVTAASCPTLVVGMPNEVSVSPICPMCAAVRDETQGERWFCAAHTTEYKGLDHVAGPMTVWTGGSLMW
jgi:hypothetical protein